MAGDGGDDGGAGGSGAAPAAPTAEGAVTGIIKPPPDLRLLVDKTAEHVARNGRQFEAEIRKIGKAKFDFINPGNPYHRYYVAKIDEIALEQHRATERSADGAGSASASAAATAESDPAGADAPLAPKPDADSATAAGAQPAEEKEGSGKAESAEGKSTAGASGSVAPSAVPTLVSAAPRLDATAELVKKKRTKPPPQLQYTLDHPVASTPSFNIELVKITAKYAAVLGRGFVSRIAVREQFNPDFHFLQPQDANFRYFTALVDQYRKQLRWKDTCKTVQSRFGDKLRILDRAVHRVEWERLEEERRQAKEQTSNEDVIAFNQIDWHDFALVGTVDFDDEEEKEKDAPSTEHSGTTGKSRPLAPRGSSPAAAPAAGKSTAPGARPPPSSGNDSDSDIEMDSDSDDGGVGGAAAKLEIRQDYKPRVVTSEKRATTGVLPDGRQMAADDVNSHVRVELIDPKWREQNERFLERQKSTPFIEKDVEKNLARMAANRPDVFGVDEETVRKTREADKRKREEAREVWDGTVASAIEVQTRGVKPRGGSSRSAAASTSPAPAPPFATGRSANGAPSPSRNRPGKPAGGPPGPPPGPPPMPPAPPMPPGPPPSSAPPQALNGSHSEAPPPLPPLPPPAPQFPPPPAKRAKTDGDA